jgi:hypothetical protein
MIMIESEGITEEVTTRRTDVVNEIVSALGTEKVMFEAADPRSSGGASPKTASHDERPPRPRRGPT